MVDAQTQLPPPPPPSSSCVRLGPSSSMPTISRPLSYLTCVALIYLFTARAIEASVDPAFFDALFRDEEEVNVLVGGLSARKDRRMQDLPPLRPPPRPPLPPPLPPSLPLPLSPLTPLSLPPRPPPLLRPPHPPYPPPSPLKGRGEPLGTLLATAAAAPVALAMRMFHGTASSPKTIGRALVHLAMLSTASGWRIASQESQRQALAGSVERARDRRKLADNCNGEWSATRSHPQSLAKPNP